ncbi:TIGR00153 family protein [Pleionea litopenaei]|uniref:TIGR00153 family protein n=1 Tax=Pleionea litopenaei TaxID=3070815 RepID=A0AA51RQ44_9GAMM|nr:TIGR00153 family protein [Pleionea sp. HL-JVS1]WMS85548.1 TIGR00153 family protein [Pleionea sp. HL-JVS1]
MNLISDLFAASPFRPMQDHISKVHECVSELKPFLEAVCKKDWDTVDALQQKISGLENDADDLKKDIRLKLPGGIFLPVARTDLLGLVTAQDKLANRAKDIAGLMTGRHMEIPEALQPSFMAYLERCIDASAQAHKAIHELDELVETGFRGREALLVEKMISELDAIENDTDVLQRQLRKELFKIENDLPAVHVIFLYKVIDWIGDLGDRAEKVGSDLELMLARK